MSPLNVEKDSTKFFDKTQNLYLYQHMYLTSQESERARNQVSWTMPSQLEKNVVEKVDCTAPLGKSDHVCLEFSYLTGVDVKPTCERRRNYWKADYSATKKRPTQIRLGENIEE